MVINDMDMDFLGHWEFEGFAMARSHLQMDARLLSGRTYRYRNWRQMHHQQELQSQPSCI